MRWESAFPEKAALPEGMEPRKEWEAALGSLRWLKSELDEAGRSTQQLLVLGDGGFCVARFFRELPCEVVLMARYARNRNLFELSENEGCWRGRRRKYGEKARKSHEWLTERSGWRQTQFMVRARKVPPRYRVEGTFVLEGSPERPVLLMVVRGVNRQARGRHRKQRDPSFFSDLRCPGG